jgi:hypothetical protein
MLLFLENVLVIRVFRQHGTMGIIGDNIIFSRTSYFESLQARTWAWLATLAFVGLLDQG